MIVPKTIALPLGYTPKCLVKIFFGFIRQFRILKSHCYFFLIERKILVINFRQQNFRLIKQDPLIQTKNNTAVRTNSYIFLFLHTYNFKNLTINFSKHNILCTDNGNYICNHMTSRHHIQPL